MGHCFALSSFTIQDEFTLGEHSRVPGDVTGEMAGQDDHAGI